MLDHIRNIMKTPAQEAPSTQRWLRLYAVIDERAHTIVGPIVHDYSHVPLVRQITEAVNKPGSMINQNPEDFAIYELGAINEYDGTINAQNPPELVVRASVLKQA